MADGSEGSIATPGAEIPQPPKLPLPVGPEGLALTAEVIERLKARLAQSAKAHVVPIDPIMFNGGTVIVLGLTALATFLPTLLATGQAVWAAPLCSAVAGLFIAMERALGFGARWRYHKEM